MKYQGNYFNGHDHNLQHIKEVNSTVNYIVTGKRLSLSLCLSLSLFHIKEVNSTVNYIITGAGMQCCYPENYASLELVPKGSVRFAVVRPQAINKSTIALSF